MGLDAVELVMAMEETFDVTISDEDAVRTFTPKDAIQLIASKLEMSQQAPCLTQTAFYFLRDKVVNGCHALSRLQFRIDTDLREKISKNSHAWVWKTIANEGKVRLPGLERPRWLTRTIEGLSLITAIVTILWLMWAFQMMWGLQTGGTYASVVIGLCIAYLASTLGFYLTKPYCREIPADYGKISKLVRVLVSANLDFFKKNGKQWTYEQIRTVMKCLVMEVLGTEEYQEDWRFVEDFGMD